MAVPVSNARSALRTRLMAFSSLPAVAWEGRTFKPVVGTSYLRETLRLAASTLKTLGPSGRVRDNGLYMLTYYRDAEDRLNLTEEFCGLLQQWFYPGQHLFYAGQRVVITGASMGAGVVDAAWRYTPVTVQFYFDWLTPPASVSEAAVVGDFDSDFSSEWS